VARANGRDRGHLLCTAIDHPSVLEPLRRLAAGGFALDVLPVDGQGFLDPGDLARALRRDTVLVSVIHGHNELATVQPLAPLAAVCAEAGVPLHVDACQSFTRVPIDVASVPIALVTLNAHKIHGPQGVGALYVRPGTHLWPGQVGGGQERGLRAGTLNTAGIVGFAEAVAQASPERLAWLHDLRSFLAAALVDRLPGVVLHGPRDGALPHVLSAAFPGCVGQDLLLALARRGYQVSAGSACKAGSGEPSRALLAAGVEADMARATLRISPSHQTTRAEIEDLIDALVDLTRGSRGVP
jgi:cysteine desulfurase